MILKPIRAAALLLAIAALLLLPASCTPKATSEPAPSLSEPSDAPSLPESGSASSTPESPTPTPSPSQVSTPTPTPDSSPEPTPTPTPEPTPEPTPTPPENDETDEQEYALVEHSPGVYRIPLEIERGIDTVERIGQYLLAQIKDEDGTRLVSFDLTTGKILSEVLVGQMPYGTFLLLEGGGYAFTTFDGNFIHFNSPFDRRPRQLHMALPYEEGGETESYEFFDDLTYVCTRNERCYYGNLLEDGEEEIVLDAGYAYYLPLKKENGKILFSAAYFESPEEDFLEYDLSTKELVLKEQTIATGDLVCGEYRLNTPTSGRIRVWRAGDPDAYTEIRTYDYDEMIVDVQEGRILTVCEKNGSDTYCTVYDFSGKILARSYVYSGGFGGVYLPTAHGYLLVKYDDSLDDGAVAYGELYFLDLRYAPSAELPDYPEETGAIVRKLENDYPLTILTAERALIEFPDFTATAESDEQLVYVAVSELDRFLSDLPEGFFNELFSPAGTEGCTHLTVCFTGELTPTEYGISTPAAYAYWQGQTQFIVIDVRNPACLRTNLAHETMHAIDRRLDVLCDYDAYPDWFDYVPPDDAYNYGYQTEDGADFYDETYTLTEDGEAWFIDSYSRTFPTEDRARLFETYFTGEADWFLSRGQHITDRMRYLSSVIRENFACMKNAPAALWETLLS